MSKAQMEIFGLVIIVILVSLGLLFTVIVLTKQPSEKIPRVKESVMAYNFLNTMMSTTSQACGKRTVRQLLQDCAVAGEDWTGAPSCEDHMNTCDKLFSMVDQMLTQTIGLWGKDYEFFIEGTSAVEQLKLSAGDCSGEREGSSRPEKIRAGLDVTVTLHICS